MDRNIHMIYKYFTNHLYFQLSGPSIAVINSGTTTTPSYVPTTPISNSLPTSVNSAAIGNFFQMNVVILRIKVLF